MKRQAEEWLVSAGDDLKVIEKIISDESLTNMIAFHSQQAIEKAFKSILEEYEAKVPRVHDLIKLKEMTEKYIDIEIDRISLESINEIYTDTRYPSDMGLVPTGRPSLKLAKEFFDLAIRIKEEIAVFLTLK